MNTRKHSKKMHPLICILIDAVIVCIILGSIYYFLCLRDKPDNPSVVLPTPFVAPTASATPAPTEVIGSDTPAPTLDLQYAGMFGANVGDKLGAIGSEPVITENSYKSENVVIEIARVEKYDTVYFVADIYIRDLSSLRTAFGSNDYRVYDPKWVYEIGAANNAIAAFSGDYCQFAYDGLVIRNGVLYSEKTNTADVAVLYNDGVLATYGPGEVDIDYIKTNGAFQAWCFGPSLLDKNGNATKEFNSTVPRANPRTAIGYYEPGHYILLVADGRQPDYSVGLTLKDMSQIFYELGCKSAYNLDGGQSATMSFGLRQDSLYNRPYNGGRRVGDIIYICEPQVGG